MNDSNYLKTKRLIKLRTSGEQDAKCLEAESLGLEFCKDFGIHTPMQTIRVLAILKDIERFKARKKAS